MSQENVEQASQFLGGDRVARILRIAPAAVYEAARRGELAFVRDAAGYIRFERSVVEAWRRDQPAAYERAVRRSVELFRRHMERFPALRESTPAEARDRGIPL